MTTTLTTRRERERPSSQDDRTMFRKGTVCLIEVIIIATNRIRKSNLTPYKHRTKNHVLFFLSLTRIICSAIEPKYVFHRVIIYDRSNEDDQITSSGHSLSR